VFINAETHQLEVHLPREFRQVFLNFPANNSMTLVTSSMLHQNFLHCLLLPVQFNIYAKLTTTNVHIEMQLPVRAYKTFVTKSTVSILINFTKTSEKIYNMSDMT